MIILVCLAFLLSLPVVSSADVARTPCCTPEIFTAELYVLSAVLTSGSSQPSISDDVIHLTYDYTRRQTRQIGRKLVDPATGARTNYIMFSDYKHHKVYTLKNGMCTVEPLTFPMIEPCVAANFNYGGSYHIYSGVNSSQVHMWSGLYLGALRMSVHVSGSECEPVSLSYHGVVPGVGVHLLTTSRFLDVTTYTSLPPAVFSLPDECKHLPQLQGK
ncbi:uncharacterized protein LOC127881681 [Dreissena polymorpha]|uniref:Uncharacterized protein n=1 Tax=Dreissena polymorpha TaxID=45954 RepID=A0A9D4JRA2_DREPO|nr:uncharacterized protein LOC127881681 [Dreissena polymorpha]KAH3819949.1 hypothetical protein DPMN_121693 [Dreissena polymorpha]